MANKIVFKKKDELPKAVEAIHTSGDLPVTGRRMVNILLLNAYDDLLIPNKTHEIPVAYLMRMLNWESSNNVSHLREVITKLVTTKLEFDILADESKKKKASWGVMSFLSFGGIEDGICRYRYDPELAKKLYSPEIYSMISVGLQSKISGSYAVALWENCGRYKKVGQTGWWDVEIFRKLVGATNESYAVFKYLKRDVITPAIKEVNKVSDILLEVEYRYGKRNCITQMKFHVKENPQGQLLKGEGMDEFDEIRKLEIFGRLREHGIGERLAISWISEKGEERIREIVEYVEDQDKKNLIKKTTAGYMHKVVTEGGAIPSDRIKQQQKTSEVAAVKQAEEKKAKALETAIKDDLKAKGDLAISNLSEDELNRFYAKFKAITKLKPAQIKEGINHVFFRSWLRQELVSQ